MRVIIFEVEKIWVSQDGRLRPYLKIQDGGQMSMKRQATYGKVFS
jgi:hypothetical protein